MIADANPELGDTMRALAAVYQAALERSLAERFADIGGCSGIPGYPPGPSLPDSCETG